MEKGNKPSSMPQTLYAHYYVYFCTRLIKCRGRLKKCVAMKYFWTRVQYCSKEGFDPIQKLDTFSLYIYICIHNSIFVSKYSSLLKVSSNKYYLKNKFEFPSLYKTTMKILDCENVSGGGKHNRCVVLPANVPIVADSLKRKNQNW
jgi:hypothetical protein